MAPTKVCCQIVPLTSQTRTGGGPVLAFFLQVLWFFPQQNPIHPLNKFKGQIHICELSNCGIICFKRLAAKEPL